VTAEDKDMVGYQPFLQGSRIERVRIQPHEWRLKSQKLGKLESTRAKLIADEVTTPVVGWLPDHSQFVVSPMSSARQRRESDLMKVASCGQR